MSALPRIPSDAPCAGLRMTADEFLALGETDQRLELIDGVVVMSLSPMPLHQKIARLVMRQIEDILAPGGEVFYDTDVVLGYRIVYCPDFVVYAPGRFSTTPSRLDTLPDLVVEVLSPGNRKMDLVTKRHDYEKHGVSEYWIVDPVDMSILVLKRRGDRFVESRVTDGVLECASIPGVRVDWSAVCRVFK